MAEPEFEGVWNRWDCTECGWGMVSDKTEKYDAKSCPSCGSETERTGDDVNPRAYL